MVTPYLCFSGECEKALLFYEAVFNTQRKMCQPYGDYVPEGIKAPEGLPQWVLHAEMDICGTNFWFADEVESRSKGAGIKLVVTVDTACQAQEIFDRLADGGDVFLPPVETFYSAFHAGLTDRFGVGWNIVAQEPPSSKE